MIGIAYPASFVSAQHPSPIAYFYAVHTKASLKLRPSYSSRDHDGHRYLIQGHASYREDCSAERMQLAAVNPRLSATLSGNEDAIDEVEKAL